MEIYKEALEIATSEAIRFGEMVFAVKGQTAENYYSKKFTAQVAEIKALREALELAEKNTQEIVSDLLKQSWSSAIAKKLVIA